MNPREILLQPAEGRPARRLELHLRRSGPSEFQIGLQNLAPGELPALLEREIRPLKVLVYRIPPDLLNPNYWEPLTREGEQAVRDRLAGLITRTDGDRALLFRADRIARHRLLRDGLSAPVDLVHGYILQTTGEGLLELARAWNGRGRFEWAGLRTTADPLPDPLLSTVHNDLTQLRLSLREEALLMATGTDGLTRAVFPQAEPFRKVLEAALRGVAHASAGHFVGRIPARVLDQIAELLDGVAISADPALDVEDNGRTVEIHATVLGGMAAHIPMVVGDKVLVYYDRTSGLWAAAS